MGSFRLTAHLYVALVQDALVNAKDDGASTASATVSFEVDFRWHAIEMCMAGPGSAACVDRLKVHSAIAYNECECSAISTASSSPRNRFCRGLLCLAHRGVSKG